MNIFNRKIKKLEMPNMLLLVKPNFSKKYWFYLTLFNFLLVYLFFLFNFFISKLLFFYSFSFFHLFICIHIDCNNKLPVYIHLNMNKYLFYYIWTLIMKKTLIFIKPRRDKSSLASRHLKIIEIYVIKKLVWREVTNIQTQSIIYLKVIEKNFKKVI